MDGQEQIFGRELKGLSTPGPLSGRLSSMKVAFRPVDILLLERIARFIADLRNAGVVVPPGSFMAVRAVRGFVKVPNVDSFAGDVPGGAFTVVDYDPVRRTFLVSGDGHGSALDELVWLCFKAFETDMLVFGSLGGERPPWDKVEDPDGRLSMLLSIVRDWKKNGMIVDGKMSFVRAKDMTALKDLAVKVFGKGARK